MIGEALNTIAELIDHPRVAMIGFVFAVGATVVGYAWATQAHEHLKAQIVTDVADLITVRDIKQTERAIQRLTTRINLQKCGDPSCDIEKAERENLRDYVKSLREDMRNG